MVGGGSDTLADRVEAAVKRQDGIPRGANASMAGLFDTPEQARARQDPKSRFALNDEPNAYVVEEDPDPGRAHRRERLAALNERARALREAEQARQRAKQEKAARERAKALREARERAVQDKALGGREAAERAARARIDEKQAQKPGGRREGRDDTPTSQLGGRILSLAKQHEARLRELGQHPDQINALGGRESAERATRDRVFDNRPLDARETIKAVQDGDGRREQNVTHDLLRQVMASKAYANRVPEVVDFVRAGFAALYPGKQQLDDTGRPKRSEPRTDVTLGAVMDSMGVSSTGSLAAAERGGRQARERRESVDGFLVGGSGNAPPEEPSVDDQDDSAEDQSGGTTGEQSESSGDLLDKAVEHVRTLWEQIVGMGEDITSDALEEVAHATRGLAVIVPGEPWSGLLELADKVDDLKKDVLAIDPDRPRAKTLEIVKDFAKDAVENFLDKTTESTNSRVNKAAMRIVTVAGPVAEVVATQGEFYERAIDEGYSQSEAAIIAGGATGAALTGQYVADNYSLMLSQPMGGSMQTGYLFDLVERGVTLGLIEYYRATSSEEERHLMDKVEEYALEPERQSD